MAKRELSYQARLWMAHNKLLAMSTSDQLRKLDAIDIMVAIEDVQRVARQLRRELKRRDAEKYPEGGSP